MFTGQNGEGDPLFGGGIAVQSVSLDEVRPYLTAFRDLNDAHPDRHQVKYISCDSPVAMGPTLKDIFGPDVVILQDLWHVFHRYEQFIPNDHSLRTPFLHAIRNCILLPFDQELVDEYCRDKQITRAALNTSSPVFKGWYKKRRGRWMTPQPVEMGEAMDRIGAEWLKPGDKRCSVTGKFLATPQLIDCHANQTALAKAGFLTGKTFRI